MDKDSEDFIVAFEDKLKAEIGDIDDLDDDAPLDYIYYLIGEKPVRIGYIAPNVAVITEVLNFETNQFEIDNLYIHKIASSLDSVKIDKQEFTDICLKRGAKPPPEQ